ncbi:MAG TPA: substrate-binding domain-containing protein [Casimicrobiaceae bacterium]
MKIKSAISQALRLGIACLLFAASSVLAVEVKVMISGGFSAAYEELVPRFQRATGNTVTTVRGPSMGATPQAIPNRLQRGEAADVVIIVGEALDQLTAQDKVVAGSRVDLARSYIGMAVRAGMPKPDISTVEALKRTLLDAKSIAYSDSASGVYLSTVLFPRLGIWDQIKEKSRMIPADPVGAVVARGDAEVGFQQMSELKPVRGIEIVGALPASAQKVTVFSAGIVAGANEPVAGKALIDFLASAASAAAITSSGMEPANAK